MQYMLALYEDENAFLNLSEAQMGEVFGAYHAYTNSMKEAGAFVAGEPLEPSATGAIIRNQNGHMNVQDGPFVETKEHLGGFYLIDVPDLDAALDWAAKCPCAQTGTVEVRPIWNIGD
ncbi:YciI family protein [Parvularcula sp. IMCC14364]|uniref:YciI family protein n=1 Tax=Parvularcula sp. IMCC14364 TaxID=3067902 RepID=UPI002741405E|nr:YciI family protein [Parvularcula sp. IMCC14364]